jgi:hypothetical protein
MEEQVEVDAIKGVFGTAQCERLWLLLVLCETVATKKGLRLPATFAYIAEGADEAAFPWLLRLRATGRYGAGAKAGGSQAK